MTAPNLQGVGTILDTDVAPPPPPTTDNFLNNGHALSYATFYFGTTSGDTQGVQNGEPSGGNNPPDGVYTVKVNFDIANTGDLDAYYQQILDAIIAKDSHVDGSTTVLGVGIHAGLGNPATSEVFYAIDGNPNDVDVVPNPPGDLAQNNEIDQTWTYSLLTA
jgi:hypothetical protein